MAYDGRTVRLEAKEALQYSQPRWWKVSLLYFMILLILTAAASVLSAVAMRFSTDSATLSVFFFARPVGIFFCARFLWCLIFGYQSYSLGIYRGATTGFWNLFSGFRKIGPVFSHRFLTILYSTLWSLIPGMIFTVVALLLSYFVLPVQNLERASSELLSYIYLFLFAYYAVFILSYLLRSLRYRMTPYILLDKPLSTVRSAIKESKQMMRGKNCALLRLHLSFAGYWLLLAALFFVLYFFSSILFIAAIRAPSLSAIPGLFITLWRESVLPALLHMDLQALSLILLSPFLYLNLFVISPALAGAAYQSPSIWFYLCPMVPSLLLSPLWLYIRARVICTEAGFYDANLEKQPSAPPIATPRQNTVWSGFSTENDFTGHSF